MSTELLHIGFGNIVAINRILGIVSPNSSPSKRLMKEANERGVIIDMTHGRKTKSIVILDSGHLVLAALTPETIAGRLSLSRGLPSTLKEEKLEGKRGAFPEI